MRESRGGLGLSTYRHPKTKAQKKTAKSRSQVKKMLKRADEKAREYQLIWRNPDGLNQHGCGRLAIEDLSNTVLTPTLELDLEYQSLRSDLGGLSKIIDERNATKDPETGQVDHQSLAKAHDDMKTGVIELLAVVENMRQLWTAKQH